MTLYDMDRTQIIMLIEIVSMTVFLILGRLMQLLLNRVKKPYIIRDVNDPRFVSVYIYRIQKYGSRHIEYKFLNVDGSWKPVINKKNIIGGTIAAVIMSGILVCLVGVKDTLMLWLPIALYAVALTVVRYFEAYRILMKE